MNITTQRAVLFRNGVPIAASTASTGKPGHSTPTGIFTVLQRQVEHYSSKYNNAPMPYMQRLTWGGVALQAGSLPGYPASHGCIRLPHGFAKLLYGVTKLGMTVVVTSAKTIPRVGPSPQIADGEVARVQLGPEIYEWRPEKSPDGPLSIVISSADQKAVVLRNGIEIGAARVTIDGPITGTWAYTLRNIDAQGQHWLHVDLATEGGADGSVQREEWRRFHAPDGFKQALAQSVRPGTTVVVTSDSLGRSSTAVPIDVIRTDPPR